MPAIALSLAIAFLGAILPLAPGGTPPSADKGSVKTTRSIELLRLQVRYCVSDPAGGNAFGDFEAPSRQADQGRSGATAGTQEVEPCREQLPRMPDRGRPVSGMYCKAGPVKIRLAERAVPDCVRDR
jgi:hypothetical protein